MYDESFLFPLSHFKTDIFVETVNVKSSKTAWAYFNLLPYIQPD